MTLRSTSKLKRKINGPTSHTPIQQPKKHTISTTSVKIPECLTGALLEEHPAPSEARSSSLMSLPSPARQSAMRIVKSPRTAKTDSTPCENYPNFVKMSPFAVRISKKLPVTLKTASICVQGKSFSFPPPALSLSPRCSPLAIASDKLSAIALNLPAARERA